MISPTGVPPDPTLPEHPCPGEPGPGTHGSLPLPSLHPLHPHWYKVLTAAGPRGRGAVLRTRANVQWPSVCPTLPKPPTWSPGDGGQTWGQRPRPEIHTGKRTGRPPPRPSHARGGGGAQQLGFAGWCVPTRRTTLPAGARQLLEVLIVLSVSPRGSAPPRVTRSLWERGCVLAGDPSKPP